jgi:hypothetical protein
MIGTRATDSSPQKDNVEAILIGGFCNVIDLFAEEEWSPLHRPQNDISVMT